MEYYNDILCISGSELIVSESNPNGVMTENNYNVMRFRKQLNVLRRGCCGSPALIEFDSLPQKYRRAWISLNGDPRKKVIGNPFVEAYRLNAEAAELYRTFTFVYNDNEKTLSPERQHEYTMNASAIDTITAVLQKSPVKRTALGMSRIKDFWSIAVDAMKLLRKNGVEHTLPKNPRRLQSVYAGYCMNGYHDLIHGNYMNDSSQKITAEAGEWIVAQWMSQIDRVTIEQLFVRYNEVAPGRGWKQLKASVTIRDYLNRPEVEPIWFAARYGELAAKERYSRQNRTKLPTRRDALWYSDGTKMNYYYRDELGKTRTCNVYEVMDVYSECFLGYHISRTENYEAQYNAYKMGLQFSGHKPYEVRYDNQGGHKKLESGDFLGRLAKHAINTAPYNGKSKTIESAFGRFQSQFLHKDWYFTGQNITAKKRESRGSMEFILANLHKLPTLDEVKETYRKRRDEWNAAPHPKKGIPRIEMYRNSVNEGAKKLEMTDYIDIFGITTKDAREYTANGIVLEIKGNKHTYEVLTADGVPDMDFNRRNIGRKLYRRYFPDDLSYVELWENDETGMRRIALAQPYQTVHRALQDQTPGDFISIRQTQELNKQQRIAAEVERSAILERHGLHPHQHGLEVAPLKGITSGKKQNKDIGQMLKDVSNTSEMDVEKARRRSVRDAVRKSKQEAEQQEESRHEYLRRKRELMQLSVN